jgi:RHS repeat-associated protein
MRIKYTIICLLLSLGIANAQYQNYVLKTPDDATKTYIGRDYIRLLPGYSFKASAATQMKAQISAGLTPTDVNTFLSAANPTGSTNTDALTAINTSLAVGQIPISSSVSPTGAKCYNVPIDIVPGRQGFQPNISLSYNSQAENGLLGMGWNINGLSSIDRVNKNVFFDGKNDVVNLSNDDAFLLDGVRLMDNGNRQNPSIIRFFTTKGDIMITAFYSYLNNISYIQYFRVQYPNGLVGIFGFQDNTSSRLSYPITKLTDLNGNTIIFSYKSDNADLNSGTTNEVYYIDEINYGQCSDKPNFAKIKFTYETRPDQAFALQSTKTCIYRKRLNKIQTQINLETEPLRIYDLKYTNIDNRINGTPQTDVSRLTEIDCSSVGKSLNPIKFYCGEIVKQSIDKKEITFTGESFDLTKVNVVRGKFDSNSQNDALIIYPKSDIYKNDNGFYTFMYPAKNQIKIYNKLDQTSANSLTPIDAEDGFEGIISANIDGVGSDEIVKINSHFSGDDPTNPATAKEYFTFKIYKVSDNTVALSNTKEYSCNPPSYSVFFGEAGYAPDYLTYFTTPRKYLTGNFTGIGKTEVLSIPIISSYPSGYHYVYNYNLYVFNLTNTSLQPVYTGIPFVNSASDIVYAIDIDGDGQTEIVKIGSDHTDLYKYKDGVGFEDIGDWNLKQSDFSDRQILFADLNGDGNIDIIKSPQPNSIVQGTPTYGPAWSRKRLYVYNNYKRCPTANCGYIHLKASRDYATSNGETKCPPPYIGFYNGKVIDCNGSTPPPGVTLAYPKLINNNTQVLTYCPGCGNQIIYDLPDWDGDHCWDCGRKLSHWFWYSGPHCSEHGCSIDGSDWSRENPVLVKHNDWIYQYTDGKSIVLSETINGIARENDYKFSIHEANGDDTPELFIQRSDGMTLIYPFNVSSRSFNVNEHVGISGLPQSFEYLDYDLNSGHSYTSLLALGSNKLVCFNFPFNHTRSNMISLMVNSLGIVEKTDYSQLFEGPNYTLGKMAQFPYTDFVSPMWIVSQNCTMYNKKLMGNTNYKYQGAILHNQGLGFLGFSSVVSTDLMSNKVNTVEFDPYKLGAVTRQTNDVGESSFEYDFTVATNKKMKLLPISKTIKDNLKGNTIKVTYPLQDYDVYGNAGKEITDFGDGIKSTVINSYENRIGNVSLIGLLTNREITSERNGKTFVKREGYEYNTLGKLHYKREYIGSNKTSEIEYIYDPTYIGNLMKEILYNALTKDYLTTSYEYWDNDKCSLKSKTDPFGRVTTYTYDFNKRLLTEVMDYRNKTIKYGYDINWRRLNKVTRPDGTITDVNLDWNSGNDPRYFIKETNSSTGQPTVTKYTDALGRETRTSIGGFDGFEVYSDKDYDSFGRLLTSSAPYKANESALFTNYSYDIYNRLDKVIVPSGSSTNYFYSGNLVTVNKDGILTKTTTDVTGKIVSSTDDGGTVNYVYRADGQPEKINTAGVETSFEYNDDYNRQTKLIDPSAGTIVTAYDDANRTVTQTWDSGKKISTVANKYSQPINKTTPDFVTTYHYINGLPDSISSTNGTSRSFEYDDFGRLWKLHEIANGKSYNEVYGYNSGRLESTTFGPLDFTVNYKYKNGYLYRLEDSNGNRLREVNNVNALGMETNVLFGNGLTTKKIYTPEGLWTNVKTSNLDGSSNIIQNMSFDFNRLNGTLNSRTDNTRGLTESFTYGDLFRLKTYGITANPQTVGYYPNGNINTKTDVGAYSYDVSGKPYTLSSANTNSELTNELNVDYTVMSRPTSISNANGLSATFSYNDDYDRTNMQVKQNGTETISKYYLADGRCEIETIGGVEKQRIYLDGSPYDASVVAEKTSEGTKLYYLHRDYLGSVTQISDNSGNLAAEYSYDPWGRMRDVTNWQAYAAGSQPDLKFGRGYTGHEHINQFGLINMNARLYDPVLGRFLAPDVQVAAPEMSNAYNRYMYASNNPLMFVDLNGESGELPGSYLNPASNTYGPYRSDNNPNPASFINGGSFNSNFGSSYNYNYQGGNYSGGTGGYGGYSNAEGWGGFIIGGLQWLFGGHENREKFTGKTISVNTTPYSYSNNKIILKNPVGTGASTVYSGGKGRLSAKNNQGNNDSAVDYLSNYNTILGVITSPLQTWTLAGQGLYKTSKNLIRQIDFKNITRNSTTYAQINTSLKYLGYFGLGTNMAIDGYDYMHQKTSGIETTYNMSVDLGGYYMGPFGLIYSPAMKQYPKTLKSHPEFMYPGSDDYLH